ncbi:MAG: CsiV family protein [Thalassotalea sp.]|nr:CsiV family protein [Thalassotalea sp.]
MVQHLYKNKMTPPNKLRKVYLALASLVLTSSLSFTAQSFEQKQAQAQPEERWFEIEIILVEQLMEKDRYNEDFSVESAHKNKTKSIDLINRQLKNILTYKQQLTSCDSSALDKPITSKGTIEVTSESLQQQISEVAENITCTPYQKSDFIDPVSEQLSAVPRTLDGVEDLYANTPYLIAEEHLQLSYIVKSLKSSKEFRPLLHLAWRQAVVARTEAVPVKLIAGDNFALKQQSTPVKSEEFLTQVVNEQESIVDLSLAVDDSEADSEIVELTQAQQEDILIKQHIESIVDTLQLAELEVSDIANADITTATIGSANIDSATIDTTSIIAEIERGDIQPIIAKTETVKVVDENGVKPGWFIDGLFNVHLDHYLYINSEFNVFSQIQDTPTSNAKSLLVPFKQNRRVISGEIHYFDHPYMGMIVQIRRHQRPEPEAEIEAELVEPNDEDIIEPSNSNSQTIN